MAIPTISPSIIQKIFSYTEEYGRHIDIKKTNNISHNLKKRGKYVGVRTTVFNNDNEPTMVVEYSNTPFPYDKQSKIILAHKMYGLPYYDVKGYFGISNRDNYVILKNNNSNKYMQNLVHFLSSSIALFTYDNTRYRMRFLEKYAFDFLPGNIQCDPKNDIELCGMFGLDNEETQFILKQYPRYKTKFNFI